MIGEHNATAARYVSSMYLVHWTSFADSEPDAVGVETYSSEINQDQ